MAFMRGMINLRGMLTAHASTAAWTLLNSSKPICEIWSITPVSQSSILRSQTLTTSWKSFSSLLPQKTLMGSSFASESRSAVTSLVRLFKPSSDLQSQGLRSRITSMLAQGSRTAMANPLRTFQMRRGPDGQRVLWGIIAANCAVFLGWQQDPLFMQKHFIVSISALQDFRIYTLLTSAISHQSMSHLAVNMVTLFFFGNSVATKFGGSKLLALYCVGGIAGSLAQMGWQYYKISKAGRMGREMRMRLAPGALGASASVNSVLLLNVLLYPRSVIYVWMVIPVPAALFGLLYVISDVSGAIDGKGSNVGHAAHLGGAVVGLLSFLAYRRGLIRSYY